jgi:hypothetical protein
MAVEHANLLRQLGSVVKDDRSKVSPEPGPRSLGRAELFLTVFVTGAAALTIEILGTRIVGPTFGVSLFVWSALLAVTLGALATGYYVGGVVIDDLVELVKGGLLDPGALPENLCKLIPDAVPSGRPLLTFQGCPPTRHGPHRERP